MIEKRYIRFVTEDDSTPRWGVRRVDVVEVLAAAPWGESASPTGRTVLASAVRLLAPAQPTKVVALAYNYKDQFGDPAARTSAREPHFTDPGFEPMVFLKGPNTVADPDAEIEIPVGHEVWIEVEIAAVIGRRVRNLRDGAAARDSVFGVTICNDLTAFNVLGRDWHLARSKGLDGFCPLGPELVRGFDDSARRMSSAISGRVTQASTTANRVFDTYDAVAFVSRLMTLEPGDVVLTGTPAGNRQSIVRDGDLVVVEIEGLGALTNTICQAYG